MVSSITRSVASGSTADFGVPFPYLDSTHVQVRLNGVLKALGVDYTFTTASNIHLTAGNPAAGTVVERRRVTPTDPLTDFSPGNLDTGDLNVGILQPLYVAQEAGDHAADLEERGFYSVNFADGGAVPLPEANKVLVWNAAGLALENRTMLALGGVEVLDQDDMASNRADAVPTQQSVVAYVGTNVAVLPHRVATLAALKALDTSATTTAHYDGSTWYWNTGNYAALVTSDPLGGAYAKANAIATTAGAWVRSYQGRAKVAWWLQGATSLTAGLAAALLVGVPLLLEAGSYTTSNVAFPSNADLLMDSAAVIAPTGGFTAGDVFTASGKDNIRIEGGQFNAPYATYTGIAYIRPTNCSRVRIKNVKVISVGTHGILLDGCTQSVVEDCEVLEAGLIGILLNSVAASSVANRVVRCRSLNSYGSHGIQLAGGSYNRAVDCYSFGAHNFGLSIYQENYSSAVNCTSRRSRAEGFNHDSNYRCAFINCTTDWDGTGGYASTDFGMSINGDTVDTSFNSIIGCKITGCAKSGIAIAGATNAQFNLIADNTISAVNSLAEANKAGVLLYGGGAVNNHVVGNQCYGSATMHYGVRDESTGRNMFGQNNIMNAATGTYSLNANSVTTVETTGASKITTGTSGHALGFLDGANVWSANQTISLATSGEALTIYTADPGAAGNDVALFQDSASPAVNDVIARLVWKGRDSAANIQVYGYIQGIITDTTSTTEDFSFQWVTIQNGAFVAAATLGLGYQLGSPTGGDKGAGTVNATVGYYVNGQKLADSAGIWAASGGKIDFGAGNYTVTHSSGQLAFSGAVLSAGGIGYGPAGSGIGGTVIQATSKATTVVLNALCGEITLNAAALAASTSVAFTFTNSKIAATDNIIINHVATGTFGSYTFNARPGAGAAGIDVRNVSLGSLSEAIVIRFTILKAVNS